MKKSIASKLTLVLLVAVLMGGLARADTAEVKRRIDTERISLNLKDAAIADIFRVFKQLAGVEVQVRCAEPRKVTITFENITMRTSLNAICESAGLRWSLEETEPPVLRVECDSASGADMAEGKRSYQIYGPKEGQGRTPQKDANKDPLDEKLTIQLEKADLANALEIVAKLLDARLLMDQKLTGKMISLELRDATLRAALDTICKQVGAKWSVKTEESPAAGPGSPQPPRRTLKVGV